jgi:hypothetical protein
MKISSVHHIPLVGFLSLASLAAAACSKPVDACATNLSKLESSAPADVKNSFPTICGAVSAPTQTCIGAAKTEKDVDGCLASNKADKDAFMMGMMGAAVAGEKAAPPAPKTTCPEALANVSPTASPETKHALSTACAAISSVGQQCIAQAKVQKDVDACLDSNKLDKEAFMASVLAAAAPPPAAATPSAPPAPAVAKNPKKGRH